MPMVSIHGRALQYDPQSGRIFTNGRPAIGTDEVGIGNTYYVSSAIAGTDGTSPATACATLALALAKCTANQGDKVVILPGHAETITAATAITPAGVRIVGLGVGNKRPTFTFTTANTAGFTVAVDNVSFENIIFIGNFLSIASLFTLTTAAEFSVINCDIRDTDATHGFLSVITTTVSVNSDGLSFINNRVKSLATTTPGPAIVIANTLDRLTVTDNFVTHTVASNNVAALIEHGALVVTNAMVAWNFVYSINTDTATGALLLKTTATTGSGMICHNRVRCLDTAAVIIVPVAAVQYAMFDNLVNDGATFTSGYILPAIGAD
jgi:hypothetical protein